MSNLDKIPLIAGEIARMLDDEGVPNVLWGYAALGLVGQVKASTVSNEISISLKTSQLMVKQNIDFVVPGGYLEKAADALVKR